MERKNCNWGNWKNCNWGEKNSPLSQQLSSFNVKDTIIMLQLYCDLDTVLIKGYAY